MKFNEEQIKKALECKSVDELLALAKAEGIDLAKEEAEKYFAALKTGEIDLNDLDAVAGGTACGGYMCGADCAPPTKGNPVKY